MEVRGLDGAQAPSLSRPPALLLQPTRTPPGGTAVTGAHAWLGDGSFQVRQQQRSRSNEST